MYTYELPESESMNILEYLTRNNKRMLLCECNEQIKYFKTTTEAILKSGSKFIQVDMLLDFQKPYDIILELYEKILNRRKLSRVPVAWVKELYIKCRFFWYNLCELLHKYNF
jgi:Zn-dependent M32 family carboxypeptidase